MRQLWIIEARKEDGGLDLSGKQPTDYFGMGAITGMTDNAMARVIYQLKPDIPLLNGANIEEWARVIDSRFIARPKTW